MPIDWNRSHLKNPFGEDTITKALARKWKHQILYVSGWLKTYIFPVLCFLYTLALLIWWLYSKNHGGWTPSDTLQKSALSVLIGIFILLRIYLAAIPALVVCRDTKNSLWEYFRITTVTGDEVAGAMIAHAFSFGALPLAFLSTFQSIVYLALTDYTFKTSDVYPLVPAVFFMYLMLGLVLCAFALIGALIWRNTIGVLGGILIPLILMLLTAGWGFIIDVKDFIFRRYSQSLGSHPVTLFLAPENRISFTDPTFSRHGFTSGPGADIGTIVGFGIWLGIFAAVLWIALWLVLRYRLRAG